MFSSGHVGGRYDHLVKSLSVHGDLIHSLQVVNCIGENSYLGIHFLLTGILIFINCQRLIIQRPQSFQRCRCITVRIVETRISVFQRCLQICLYSSHDFQSLDSFIDRPYASVYLGLGSLFVFIDPGRLISGCLKNLSCSFRINHIVTVQIGVRHFNGFRQFTLIHFHSFLAEKMINCRQRFRHGVHRTLSHIQTVIHIFSGHNGCFQDI